MKWYMFEGWRRTYFFRPLKAESGEDALAYAEHFMLSLPFDYGYVRKGRGYKGEVIGTLYPKYSVRVELPKCSKSSTSP
jgi:hypothetical protein